MEWIETTGPSVEAAKERALDHLGVPADQAEIEVLETEVTGMFGRVKSEARVRARVQPRVAPERAERRDRDRQRRGRDGGRAKKSGTSGRGNDQGQGQQSRGPRGSGADAGGGSRPPADGGAPATNKGAGDGSGGGRRDRGESRSGGARSGERPARTQGAARPTSYDPAEEVSMDELVPVGTDLLQGLLAAMGMDAGVRVETSEDRLDFLVEGEDLGLLVGRGGRTVDGLQEITRAVLLRSAKGGAPFRIGVDVAGYREFRRQALTRFGTQLAERVREDGVSVVLDPMGSIDRKAVHDAVQAVDGVTSSSEGAGDSRRVVVHPA